MPRPPVLVLLRYALVLPAVAGLLGGVGWALYDELSSTDVGRVGLVSAALTFLIGTWIRRGGRRRPRGARERLHVLYARCVGPLLQLGAAWVALVPWELALRLRGIHCGSRWLLPLPLHLALLLIGGGLFLVALGSVRGLPCRLLALAAAAALVAASFTVVTDPCHVGQLPRLSCTLWPEVGSIELAWDSPVRAVYRR